MAATNTGARFVRNLAGRTSGIIQQITIDNTETLTIGDWVRVSTSGYLEVVSADTTIMGVIVGFVDRDGINYDQSKIVKEGTWSESTQTITTDSDNRSSEKAAALVDIDPFSVWSCEPDDTIGTTTSSGSSDQLGSYTDLADEDEVDETNNGAAFNLVAQLFIWGIDPEASARGLYSIAEHQIWGQ